MRECRFKTFQNQVKKSTEFDEISIDVMCHFVSGMLTEVKSNQLASTHPVL